VAHDDALAVKGNVGVAGGVRAYRDHDAGRLEAPGSHRSTDVDFDFLRSDEFAVAFDQFDPVARQLVADDVDLHADDLLHPKHEIFHGNDFFDAVRRTVDTAFAVAGKVEHRLSEGL